MDRRLENVDRDQGGGSFSKTWDALTPNVSEVIAAEEQMGAENRGHYFGVGQSAVRLVRMALMLRPEPGRRVERILDMPCGHGRVMRTLRAEFPEAELTACDIDRGGVDFCVKTFGAKGVYSKVHPPTGIFPDAGKYDVIFVGSLLTHLDAGRWPGMLRLFYELLAADGVLVFTTHGPFLAELITSGSNYGYVPGVGGRVQVAEVGANEPGLLQRARENLPKESPLIPLMKGYVDTGFGYADDGTGYGISVTQPWWVLKQLAGFEDLRVLYYRQNGWDNHQDAVAVVKRGFGLGTYMEEHPFREELVRKPEGFHVGGGAEGQNAK